MIVLYFLQLFILIHTTIANVLEWPISSQVELSEGIGEILINEFQPGYKVRCYSANGGVYLLSNTQGFSTIKKLGSFKNLIGEERLQWGKSFIETKPGRVTTGKKVIFLFSFKKFFFMYETPTNPPTFVLLKTFDVPIDTDHKIYQVDLLNENDSEEIIFYMAFEIYYLKNDFGTGNYLETPNTGVYPFGDIHARDNHATGFGSAKDGSGVVFLLMSDRLTAAQGNTKLVDGHYLDPELPNKYSHNYGLSYSKNHGLLFICTWTRIHVISWSANTFTKILVKEDANSHTQAIFDIYEDPNHADTLFLIKKLHAHLETYRYNLVEKKLEPSGFPHCYISSWGIYAQIHIYDMVSYTVGIGTPHSLLVNKLSSNIPIETLHLPIEKFDIAPIDSEVTGFVVDAYGMLQFNTTSGVFEKRLSYEYRYKRRDRHPTKKGLTLITNHIKVYEMQELITYNHISEGLKHVHDIVIDTNQWEILDIKYSGKNPDDYFVVSFLKRQYDGDNYYALAKIKKGETVPIRFKEIPRKYWARENYQLSRLRAAGEDYIMFYVHRNLTLARETEDSLELDESNIDIFAYPNPPNIKYFIRFRNLPGLDGMILMTQKKPDKLKFLHFDGTSITVKEDYTVDKGTVNFVVDYDQTKGVLWSFGSRALRIHLSHTDPDNLKVELLKRIEVLGQADITLLPIMITYPHLSFYMVRMDRSTAMVHTHAQYSSVCDVPFCSLCTSGGTVCLLCEQDNFLFKVDGDPIVYCRKICLNEGEYYIRSGNKCGSCDASCKTCDGSGNIDCLSCFQDYYFTEDRKCLPLGCGLGQRVPEPNEPLPGKFHLTFSSSRASRLLSFSQD